MPYQRKIGQSRQFLYVRLSRARVGVMVAARVPVRCAIWGLPYTQFYIDCIVWFY